MAILLLCSFSLAACNSDNKRASWSEDKESVVKSIESLDEEQKKETASTQTLLAAIEARLQSLEAAGQSRQVQIEAMSAYLEKQERIEEQERIEAQKHIEVQKRMLEKKHADELKRIKAQKRKKLALQRAKKLAAAKESSKLKLAPVPTKPGAASPVAAAEAEKNAYTAAYLALKSSRFDEASKAFNKQLDLYPGGQYADQAWYWLGETRYAQHGYNLASNAFKYVVNNYPNSVKHAAALLKLGQISQALKHYDDATKYYNQLIKEHGDSSVAEQARTALAKMQDQPEEK